MMEINRLKTQVRYNNQTYDIDLGKCYDLSIKNHFSQNGPVSFGANYPSSIPQRSGNFVGNLKEGGSCNVPIVTCNIHCTGTHTECIAHINIDSDCKIPDKCPKGFIPSYIITVKPIEANRIIDSYHCDMSGSFVIGKEAIKSKISNN